jgi:putative DNA primase/helicase
MPSRFRQWDALVRGAIIWAGQPDPYLTAVDIDAADPERADIAALLDAFVTCFGTRQVTSKVITAKITENNNADADGLRNALVGRGVGNVGTRTITAVLKSHEGTIVNSRRIRRRVDSDGATHFWVERVGGLV